MPSSRILTELWRKATTSFKNIEQSTEDDGRLPNREELREHQEAIQDIIDVFVAASMSNANTARKEPDQPSKTENISVPMISPSETSSVQSFFPPDTSRAANNRAISLTSPILPRPLKRKVADTGQDPELLGTPATATGHAQHADTPMSPKRKKSKVTTLMTPEDDAYIWQAYLTHKETADKLHLSKSAQSGLATRIAEKLHTNWQTIAARLKVLKALHGDAGGAGNSIGLKALSIPRATDINSLEGGGIDGGAGDQIISSSSSDSGSDDESESDYSTDKNINNKGEKPTASSTSISAPTPPCSLHSIAAPQFQSTAPPRPNTSKTHIQSKRTQHLRVTETPLSAPPHIARKTTFAHDDDVVLWNAYLRNGCEAPTESQLHKLVKKLNRNSTSGVSYRIHRLIAEDQKVTVKDTRPLFTASHDEYIQRKYNSNKALGDRKLPHDALCDNIAHKLQIEPVRVYYRLQRLLRQHDSDNNKPTSNSDTNSSTSSSSSSSSNTSSSNSDTSDNDDADNSPLAPRTANRYTESEDMAIYTAYLSSTVESQRARALDKVAVTLGRSKDSVYARLDRLFEDQRAVTTSRSKTSAQPKTHIPGRKRGRPRKTNSEDFVSTKEVDDTPSDGVNTAAPSMTGSHTPTHNLSVEDMSSLPSFHPATPHAGFVSNTIGQNSVPQNSHDSSSSNSNGDTNSLDDSDTEKPIVSTKALGATIAMRQQFKELSDSSTESVKSDDFKTNTQQADAVPTEHKRVDRGIGTGTGAGKVQSPSSEDYLHPPVIPTIVPIKQTTQAALAAGARLVGARMAVQADASQPKTSTATSRSQHRTVMISNTTTTTSINSNTTTTTIKSTTTPSTVATTVKPVTPVVSQIRGGSSNPHVASFLVHLQRQGMDILYPQTVHDQVLALVLGCLQHLHLHNDTPTYSTVLDCLQRCLRRTTHTLPRLKHVTNAQLRSVIVLLQRAECVVLHGGPHVNIPITMRLAGGMRTFLDLRRRHDGYLESQMHTSDISYLQDVLWPIDKREQNRLQEEMELVVNEVKRVL